MTIESRGNGERSSYTKIRLKRLVATTTTLKIAIIVMTQAIRITIHDL
jgi:hypothetical protein